MDLYYIRQQLNMGIPLTNIKLRVTDYSRVSTDHEEQKKSLKNQVDHFSEYIKTNKNWTYIEGYVDDGITGTSDVKRTNFMKMIEDARNNKFDLIITKEISRFSRNTLDSIKYTRELLSYGVAVFFVNDNINTALPDSELRLTIMSSMAQDEIRRLSERVKFGMNMAIERGEILGNNMLYGYSKDKKTGKLYIVESEADIVKEIYELYAIDNLSLSKISKKFNSKNIKTREGNKWSISTISRMIENPKYKGYYCAKKSEVIDYMTKKIKYFDKNEWITYKSKDKIPPIINEKLWDRANSRLVERKKAFSQRKKDKTIYKNRYLFSGKIYCKNHNTIFHRRAFRKAKDDYSWICSKYLKEGKKVCDSPNIRDSELNYILKDLIKTIQLCTTDVATMLMTFYSKYKESNSIVEEILNLEQKKEVIIKRKDRLLNLSIDGILTNSEFNDKNNSLNKQLQKINQRLEILLNKRENLSKKTNKNNNLKKIITTKLKSQNITNKIISLLVKKIIVSRVNEDKNHIKLDIILNYKYNNTNYEKIILKKIYHFKRGYDTTSTKRYIINYEVNFYYSSPKD